MGEREGERIDDRVCGGSGLRKALLSWSSGKDSAWALHRLRAMPDVEVVALVTNFNSGAGRVAMHAVRRELVELQAERAGLPLWAVELPWPCSNAQYEALTEEMLEQAVAAGVEAMAFGDLFLEDVRDYRVRQVAGTGIEPLFPLWGLPTDALGRAMIEGGVRAKITCLDPSKMDARYAGAEYDEAFLEGLAAGIDPCGERGEFHTFVYDAPVFSAPISVLTGEIVTRDGFCFTDVLLDGGLR